MANFYSSKEALPVVNATTSHDTVFSEAKRQRIPGLSVEDASFYYDFSQQQWRRIRTKIDLRLMPMLCLLYLFAQLDRANIGNAKIEGMKVDLHLTDKQYSIVLAIFFVPYCLLEVPSNIILKKMARPSIYIGSLVIAWGMVMTLHGFVRNFATISILRLLLGVAEAGFYPAAMYLCSQWYRPHELAFRLSLFTAIAAAAGIVSGLLAAGIAKMDSLGGYEGWRWIFIVEGGVTILAGFATFPLLVDTPARSSKWLNPDEIRYLIIQRFVQEGGSVEASKKASSFSDFVSIASDWRHWAFGFILHAAGACGYGLKVSVPTIMRGQGYSKTQSQLLSAVPYIFGLVTALLTAAYSDYLARRSVFVISGFLAVIVGFCIVLSIAPQGGSHIAAILTGLSLVTSGLYPLGPTAGSWISNNIVSAGRRAVGLAFVMTLGASGGLTGSFMYVESQQPQYPLGFGLSCGLSGGAVLVSLLLLLSFWQENRKRENMSEAGIREAYTEEQLHQMGEKSPLFRYTL